MRSAVRTGGLLVWMCCALNVALPDPAAACSITLPAPFQIDPDQQENDTVPPTTFTNVSAVASRVAGTHCHGDTCSQTSCGDVATLKLKFTPPQDDQNTVDELGYRIVWLRGAPPASVRPAIDRIQPLQSANEIDIPFGFDEITVLDADLMLIAVDRAGNESVASRPIHVEFSGCTQYFDEDSCIAQGCSAAHTLRGSTANAAWCLAPLSALAVAMRVRSRRRRNA